jgi:hypothetical protein
MRRRAKDEKVKPWRDRIDRPKAEKLQDKLIDWCNSAKPLLKGWPKMPSGIDDRDADKWEPLLAVAELAGGDWPEKARAAAVAMVNASKQQPLGLGVLLLRDIQKVWADDVDNDSIPGRLPDKVRTEEILRGLNAMDESPWPSYRKGEPLNPRGLSQLLRKYGIESKTQRVGDNVFTGYARAQFEDAWKRYVEPLADDDEGLF